MNEIKELKINENIKHILYEDVIEFTDSIFNYSFFHIVRFIKKEFLWLSWWEIDPHQQAGSWVQNPEDIGVHYMTKPKKDPGGWVRSTRINHPIRKLGVVLSRVVNSFDNIDISFIPLPMNDFYPY